MINGVNIIWKKQIDYLGVQINSAKHFVIRWSECNGGFQNQKKSKRQGVQKLCYITSILAKFHMHGMLSSSTTMNLKFRSNLMCTRYMLKTKKRQIEVHSNSFFHFYFLNITIKTQNILKHC